MEVGPRQDCPAQAAGLAALPDRLRLPFAFDPGELAIDLARLRREPWVAHFVTANYEGDWSILPLRAPRGVSHPILRATSHPGQDDWEDTDLLARTPAFAAVLSTLRCPVGAARLMRLAPGARIKEHRDGDLSAEFGTVRLHVPIETNPDVDFHLNGELVVMRVGEMWYLRLADPHRAGNAGEVERIHLVIDATLNDWLAAVLVSAAGFARDRR